MKDKCFFYRARAIGVHDGDTIKVDVDLGFSMSLKNLKVRLTGIDTAEMTSKDPELKKKAVAARDWLREKCTGADLFLESAGQDKYGRWLGKVYLQNGLCLNEELVKLGLAVSYDGGKKHQELLKD